MRRSHSTGSSSLPTMPRSKKIALGGYSLLASRSINPDEDAINPATGRPGGMIFGNSPCLCSNWGQGYFAKLRRFFEVTGCNVLENDGSYPGDVCASTKHPGHKDQNDSQWNQWEAISDFYRWARGAGSLPQRARIGISWSVRARLRWAIASQTGLCPGAISEIIERQNIYDGTWEKAPSMGWMFVPLTEYQGGGAAATIEPLAEHLRPLRDQAGQSLRGRGAAPLPGAPAL